MILLDWWFVNSALSIQPTHVESAVWTDDIHEMKHDRECDHQAEQEPEAEAEATLRSSHLLLV
jgi:hypothetical protein